MSSVLSRCVAIRKSERRCAGGSDSTRGLVLLVGVGGVVSVPQKRMLAILGTGWQTNVFKSPRHLVLHLGYNVEHEGSQGELLL